jgi:anti-sigma regulatory factor (Ser/Thr protein kinase)
LSAPREDTLTMQLSLPADASTPAAARMALGNQGLSVPASILPDLQLLASELVTNSVRHANLAPGQHIELRVRIVPGNVRVEVEDPGPGFTPTPRRPGDRRDDGWGLYLVERIADRWGVVDGPPAIVWFEIDWPAEA